MGRDDVQLGPPPDTPRHFRMHRYQLIGIPILLLLPLLLSLAGVFGESWEIGTAQTGQIAVTVRYPARHRYKQLNSVEIWIESRAAATIDSLTISLDSAYANRFSTVQSVPAFDEPYRLALEQLAPGERRLAKVELQAERYGAHEGELIVVASDTARIRLRTFVFP